VNISKGESLLFSSRFETILEKRSPILTFELVSDQSQNQSVELRENINLLGLIVTLKDRISGTDIYSGTLRMRIKDRQSQTIYAANDNGQFRLEL
jgi:hypothetical protein